VSGELPLARQILVRQLGVNLCRYATLGTGKVTLLLMQRSAILSQAPIALRGRGMSLCAAAAR